MRSLSIVLFILTISPSFSYSQSKPGLGIKGGINIATQYTSGEGENVYNESLMRFHGGVYLNIFFHDKFALQPELMISGKGTKWSDPSFETSDLLTYIDLPLLIRYQPIDLLNIHAGPQIGYLISAMQDPVAGDEKVDIKDWYNNLDLGLAFGAEANLPIGVNITARYILGISSASNEVEYIDPWKNNFIQVSLGYRIKGR